MSDRFEAMTAVALLLLGLSSVVVFGVMSWKMIVCPCEGQCQEAPDE